jgi:glycosyltransferase involved in cell wall biosynthesis
MDLISVVVPCFNEQEVVLLFYDEMSRVAGEMSGVDIEMIFVDDGSTDRTLECFRSLSERDKRVRYISFTRNFGKEAAMFAGLENAKGDYVAIMDADLQDPPALLPEMYKAVKEEGFDSVATRRSSRKGEPPVRTFFAKLFYRIINKISKVELVPGARDYRLMSRI